MMFSQNGFSAKDYSLIATYTVPGTSVRVSLRKGDVSVVLLELMRRFHKEVEPLHQADTGGYNPRSIIGAGSRDLSNHASGTAVDVRWRDHPLGRSGTYSAAQRAAISRILRDMGGVIRWGGNYHGRKDEMHFEINASLSHVTNLADAIRNGGKPVEKAQSITAPKAVIKKGSRGPVVKYLQQRLNAIFPAYSRLKTDGDFGPKTEAVIKEFQRRTGLQPDGDVGPKTKAMLKRFGITL